MREVQVEVEVVYFIHKILFYMELILSWLVNKEKVLHQVSVVLEHEE